MPFDINAFDLAQVKFPTKKIPVPELKAFFDEDETPEFEIRGLTGNELAIVNEAVETVNKTRIMIEALSKGSESAMKKGLETFLNKVGDESSPEDAVRRLKMLELGTVPSLPEHICVKLASAKGTMFYKLTNEIIRMTGDGAELGE